MAKRKDVLLLQQSVERTTRLLAGRSIPVHQIGSKASVQYDPKTLEPICVNIPVITDEATDEFIAAIHGFIDHEVAHVLYSDASIIAIAIYDGLIYHNGIEDCMIEWRSIQEFPGARVNLSKTREMICTQVMPGKVAKAQAKGVDLMGRWNLLSVSAFRAWAGHREHIDFMADKWHLIQEVVDNLKEFIPLFVDVADSETAIMLARAIQDKLYKNGATPPPPPKGKPSPSEEESDEENDEGESAPGKNESSDEGDEGEESDGDSDGSDDGEDADGDSSDVDGRDAESDDEEADDSDDAGEEAGKGDSSDTKPDGDNEDDSDDSNEESDGNDAGEEAGDTDEGDNDSDTTDGDSELDATQDSSPVCSEEETKPSAPETKEEPFEPALFQNKDPGEVQEDDDLSKLLSQLGAADHQKAKYVPYTRKWDKIDPPEYVDTPHLRDMLRQMQEKVDIVTGGLARHLARMFIAMNKNRFEAGKYAGKLNNPDLYRLKTGDSRVFKTKEITKTKETAVTLLIDNSGSMNGQKIEAAMLSAWAMAEALHKIGIPFELIGFTTSFDVQSDERHDFEEGQSNFSSVYSRFESLYMPVFKSFSENFNTASKLRMCRQTHGHMHMNIDGESLAVAGRRIMQQPQENKVIIVLSDGLPNCDSMSDETLNRDLKATIARLEKDGVKIVGIGICNDSVKRFYKKCVVINSVDDLPGTVIKQLGDLVLSR